MFKGSEKEYELLKSESDTIRKSIIQFMGLIISVAGIAVAVAKLYISPEGGDGNSLIILGAITAGLVAITLLFEIIWYKFKSHNRYIGYIQLLTQEIGCVELTEELKKAVDSDDFSYLDKVGVSDKQFDPGQNLYTWEYMMARLNNVDFENLSLNGENVRRKIKEIYFKFEVPSPYLYASISKKSRDKLNANYYNNVVSLMYLPDEILSEQGNKRVDKDDHSVSVIYAMFSIVFNRIWRAILGLIDLYLPIGHTFFKRGYKKVDRKYLTTGWLFPKKVIQVVFFPIVLLLLLFYSVLFLNYDFTIELNHVSYSVTVLLFLIFLINFIWIFRYIAGLNSVIFGEFSAEYFGWCFFIFRVQLLNVYNVFPIYYSRNFIRYFKAMSRLDFFADLYKLRIEGEVRQCSICSYRKPEYFVSKLFSNQLDCTNSGGFDLLCDECHGIYKKGLLSATKMLGRFWEFDIYIMKKNGQRDVLD